jgi:aldehyde dehydrogenase (NAD+)
VVERAGQVVAGDPFDPGVTMGPIISAGSLDRIQGLVDQAVESGAGRLVIGGHRIGGDLADGFFFEPTLLADVDNQSEIAQNEIFGPVLCVIPFDDEDEAVSLANATQYGLAAYAHTGDMHRARRLIRDLQAGNVHINGTGPGPLSPASPFGGVKQSGYGRQGGRLGLAEFLEIKNVYFNV